MTDSTEELRSLPDRPNLRHLKDQAKNLLKPGGVKSLTEAQFQIARLVGPSSRLTSICLKRPGSSSKPSTPTTSTRQNSHDPQPYVTPRSAWLCQEWATHLGCGMPRAVGTAQSREAGNGSVDDRSRIRRPPGWRWTPNAGSARRSHCDDGASRFPSVQM